MKDDPIRIFTLCCSIADLAKLSAEQHEILRKANEINRDKTVAQEQMIEQLTTRAEEAEAEREQAINMVTLATQAAEGDAPGEVACLRKQLEDQVKKTETAKKVTTQYRTDCKKAEDKAAGLEAEITSIRADRGRAREREREPSHEQSSLSRSRERRNRANEGVMPPPTRQSSRARAPAPTPTPSNASNVSNTSSTTPIDWIVVDPTQKEAVKTDRAIPNPDKFTGYDKSLYYPWMQQMEMKLRSTSFNSVTSGLIYIQGFLTGKAWILVAARVPSAFGKPVSKPYVMIEEMLKHLQRQYADANAVNKALNALAVLMQQPNQSFNEFYTEYQGHVAYCNLGEDT